MGGSTKAIRSGFQNQFLCLQTLCGLEGATFQGEKCEQKGQNLIQADFNLLLDALLLSAKE